MNINRGTFNFTAVGPCPKNGNVCSQYILAKLLLGNIFVKRGAVNFKQSVDYSSLTPVVQTNSSGAAFLQFIVNEGICNTSAAFIKKTLPDNRPFFDDLLWEYSNYFEQTCKGSHTSAFIFLYRVIERMSFSIPALYFSCSNDYYATFNDVKNILDEDGQGELGLLKKFIDQNNFLDSTEKSVIYDINFVSSYGLETKFFNAIKTKIKPELKSSDITIHKMQIEFINILGFFINTRNRFFHSKTGKGQFNIRAHEIEDTDGFFSILNPVFCSYASFLVLRSISKKYQ